MNILIMGTGLLRKIGGIAWAVCISLVITSCGSGPGTTQTGVNPSGFSPDVLSCSSPPTTHQRQQEEIPFFCLPPPAPPLGAGRPANMEISLHHPQRGAGEYPDHR